MVFGIELIVLVQYNILLAKTYNIRQKPNLFYVTLSTFITHAYSSSASFV